MNRLQLRSDLRRYLAEAGSAKFDDTRLNDELNRSARALAGQLGLIQREVTAVTDEDGRVSVPDLVNVTGAVRYGSAGIPWTLPVITYAQQYDHDGRGPLATGSVRALIVDEAQFGPGVVGLWPSPGEGATVSLLAFVDGGSMAADTDIPWGGRFEVYHDVIALHAAHQLTAHGGASGAREPVWVQRFQFRLEELRDRGTASALVSGTRMGSMLGRRGG